MQRFSGEHRTEISDMHLIAAKHALSSPWILTYEPEPQLAKTRFYVSDVLCGSVGARFGRSKLCKAHRKRRLLHLLRLAGNSSPESLQLCWEPPGAGRAPAALL